jgi:hypothetical protein
MLDIDSAPLISHVDIETNTDKILSNHIDVGIANTVSELVWTMATPMGFRHTTTEHSCCSYDVRTVICTSPILVAFFYPPATTLPVANQ